MRGVTVECILSLIAGKDSMSEEGVDLWKDILTEHKSISTLLAGSELPQVLSDDDYLSLLTTAVERPYSEADVKRVAGELAEIQNFGALCNYIEKNATPEKLAMMGEIAWRILFSAEGLLLPPPALRSLLRIQQWLMDELKTQGDEGMRFRLTQLIGMHLLKKEEEN